MSSITARLRGHMKWIMLTAAVATALAAALPAASGASVIDVYHTTGKYEYKADAGEVNNLVVTNAPDGSVVFADSVPLRIVDHVNRFGPNPNKNCRQSTPTRVICHQDLDFPQLDLADGNDSVFYAPSIATEVLGGGGNDTIFGGVRENPQSVYAGLLFFNGGPGTDLVTYRASAAPVKASIDGDVNDGHFGPLATSDLATIGDDVEIVEGSRFDDTITGSNLDRVEYLRGHLGNDTISGLGGTDVFDEGAFPNGSDTYNGGGGIDRIDYSQRTTRVDVSLNMTRDDGETGERDFVDPNVNSILGGRAADTLVGSAGDNELNGGDGNDGIFGGDGNDRLIGAGGMDTLLAEGGDDVVDSARDGAVDVIRCGEGVGDTLTRSLFDLDVSGCETITTIS